MTAFCTAAAAASVLVLIPACASDRYADVKPDVSGVKMTARDFTLSGNETLTHRIGLRKYRGFMIAPLTGNEMRCKISRNGFSATAGCKRAEHLIDLAYNQLRSERQEALVRS